MEAVEAITVTVVGAFVTLVTFIIRAWVKQVGELVASSSRAVKHLEKSLVAFHEFQDEEQETHQAIISTQRALLDRLEQISSQLKVIVSAAQKVVNGGG